MARPPRRRPASDDDSDSDEGASVSRPAVETEAEKYQKLIMMQDLGTETRDYITSSDKGPRARHISQRMIHELRECNQEGTDAAGRAAQDRKGLTNWSNFHRSDDADAGNEALNDLGSGNTHRINIREGLRELAALNGGNLTLDDIDDRGGRRRGMPPPLRNHAGNSAAFNDRGAHGRGRGGGFAGRGVPRGGGSSTSARSPRPLDPAVDPDREYVYKDSSRKRRPNVQMVNNKVTMGPGKAPAGSSKRKKPGHLATPPQYHGPMPKLAEPSTFMDVALKRFRQQNDAQASAPQAPPPAPVPGHSIKAQVHQPTSSSPKQGFKEIQTISRSELVPKSRRQSGFTDGNMTSTSLSGFSPSINGDEFTMNAASEPTKGLGITGVALPRASTASAETLMDVDIPAANNAVLTPSLRASPEETTISIPKSDFEQYQAFKAIMSGSRSTQDLLEWLDAHKKKTLQAEKETDISGNKNPEKEPSIKKETVVNIAAGYTIGSSRLESIIGDRNALLPAPITVEMGDNFCEQHEPRAKAAIPVVASSTTSAAPVTRLVRETLANVSGAVPNHAIQAMLSAPVQAVQSIRSSTAGQQEADPAIPSTGPSTGDTESKSRAPLQAQMQTVTKSMARTKISADGVSSAGVKASSAGKSRLSNGHSALPVTNEPKSSRSVQESSSSIGVIPIGGQVSTVPGKRDKRVNPFVPREAGKAEDVTLESTHQPVKIDVGSLAAEIDRRTVPDEDKTGLPWPRISRPSFPQVDQVVSTSPPPEAKGRASILGKKGITDSKWASSTFGASTGFPKQAANSNVYHAEAEHVPPLRTRAGNQVVAGASFAARPETDKLSRSASQKPAKSTKSPLKASAAPIFRDSRNLKHNSSTLKKSGPPAPKKFVPPGLQWIQKEQEEQRELAPDEIQQVSNSTDLSRESREALGLASDILRKYRDLD
ncbi:uncharacterized protein AB675_2149 [Cyphellophora attinorum]|uniref:Uncharacterized protein n=1 Tax=Cyphellophora attinorum TaxID=1664694 RepID=A0A0N0NPT9_9EURO|nr:uncharacterized protein AB675_2149 [Phialophora attinorum]KPI43141.1 hypothetical protein AB675_2149 [Phialophora attinorum]